MIMRRGANGRPLCTTCGEQGEWGEPHHCPGPSGMTGAYVFDHGECGTHPKRYEVQFAFEGETWFDDEADAQAAAKEYDRIVADIVHGDELRGLRRALATAIEQVEEADVPFGFASEAEWQASELAKARVEVERMRKELHRAACNVRALSRYSMMSNPFSAPLAALADKLDAMSRGDGAS